mgnify:CR=1 FL=1
MKRSTSSVVGMLGCATAVTMALGTGTANAASCSSITAEIPYGQSGLVVAHSQLNCSGNVSGWVKSTLVRVRTALPDWNLASNTDSTQNSNGNFNAYAKGCDKGNYGYKTVADSHLGWTTSSVRVSVSC